MSTLPPLSWDISLDKEGILSGNPQSLLAHNEKMIRSIKDNGERTAQGILGASAKFAPVVTGSSTAGSGTYDVQAGLYHIQGRLCWFTINLRWDDANHSGTGNVTITGMPFPSHEFTNCKMVFPCHNIESGSEFVGMAVMEPDARSLSIFSAGGTALSMTGADYDLQITGVYRTR